MLGREWFPGLYGIGGMESPPLGKKSRQTSPVFPQDGILLGAVGAYDWNGAVLKETSSGKVIPLRESYLQEFPEELKNHGAYLGEKAERGRGGIRDFICNNRKHGIFLGGSGIMGHLWDAAQEHPHLGRAQLRPRSTAQTGFKFRSG